MWKHRSPQAQLSPGLYSQEDAAHSYLTNQSAQRDAIAPSVAVGGNRVADRSPEDFSDDPRSPLPQGAGHQGRRLKPIGADDQSMGGEVLKTCALLLTCPTCGAIAQACRAVTKTTSVADSRG